jgi:hypothetical protein
MDRTFLFVNHDATTLGARTDFKTINTHMQKHHRKQRRRPLRSSSSKSLPVDQLRMVHRQKLAPSHSLTSDAASQSNHMPHSAQDNMMNCQNVANGEGAICERGNLSPGGPRSILQQGNSDPFSSLASPINPMMNSLLSWHRDVDLPTQYPYESINPNNSTSTNILRDWQHAVTALHDPCMAHAFISSLAGCKTLSTGRHDCVELGLVSKIKASQVLRTYPAGGYAWTKWKIYDVLISMIWADVATGDVAPAGLHLRMLYHLIRLHDLPEAFDPWWRGKIVWADVEYAAMQLSRPLFDVDQWSFETYYTDWIEEARLEEYWSSNFQELSRLDPSITDEAVKAVFRDLKKLLAVEKFHSVHPPPAACSVYQWMRARKIRCESQLLSMYADSVLLAQNKDWWPGLNDHLAKECICLAAISWVAISYDYVIESKKRLRLIVERKYGLFLARLRETITRCSNLLRPRLRLWVLFIGAVIEQCVGSESDGIMSGNWHQSRLATQAGLMGMKSFHQVREVLFDFLYVDRLKFLWAPLGP